MITVGAIGSDHRGNDPKAVDKSISQLPRNHENPYHPSTTNRGVRTRIELPGWWGRTPSMGKPIKKWDGVREATDWDDSPDNDVAVGEGVML